MQWTERTARKTRLHLFCFGGLGDGTQGDESAELQPEALVLLRQDLRTYTRLTWNLRLLLPLPTKDRQSYLAAFLTSAMLGCYVSCCFIPFRDKLRPVFHTACFAMQMIFHVQKQKCLTFSPALLSSYPCFFFSPFPSLLLEIKPGASSKLSIHSTQGPHDLLLDLWKIEESTLVLICFQLP